MPDATLVEALRARLTAAVNDDGGWGYYAGKTSRLEPTCWAVLALSALGQDDPALVRSGLAFLGHLERADGLLLEPNQSQANLGLNGLALIVLQSIPDAPAELSADVRTGIVRVKGVELPQPDPSVLRQDNSIQAWPWTEGTFSWVEPTAWCLLALKKSRAADPAAAARLRDGEALLFDRVCTPAGWNHGNTSAFTQDLRPYVSTTALALLALRDRPDNPDVAAGLAWLEQHRAAERSAMAMSLTMIALRAFDRPFDDLADLLVVEHAATAFLENVHLSAMALYAVTMDRHRAAPFVLDGIGTP